jgi:hypothetical protein
LFDLTEKDMTMTLNAEDMEAISDLGGEFAPSDLIDENFEFDSSESTEDVLESGGFIDAEGWYHFEITKVEFNLGSLDDKGKENTPHILVTCKSLNNVKGQCPPGSLLWHRIYVAQKDGSPAKQGSIDSMYRFGIGCGLLKWGKNSKGAAIPVLAKTGLPKIPMAAWKDAVGSQFLAMVKKEKPQPGTDYGPKFAIPMGRTYRPDHPDVSHVQKNLEALAAIGIHLTNEQPAAAGKAASSSAGKKGAAGTATGGGATSAAKQTQQALEPVAAAADAGGFDMDGL